MEETDSIVELTAKEAAELTKKNAIQLKALFTLISDMAKNGRAELAMEEYISVWATHKLMEAGFSIRKATSLIGEPLTLISWEHEI